MKFTVTNPRPSEVPPAHAEHPLVRGRYFYTLPVDLLDALKKTGVAASCARAALDVERELSERIGDHGYAAGFVDGRRIPYHLLADRRPLKIDTLDERLVDRLGWTPKQLRMARHGLDVAHERLGRIRTVELAYVGWLSTNPQFLTEQDDLLREFTDEIRADGFPLPVAGSPSEQIEGLSFVTEDPFVDAFREFAIRWRLQTLAGPNLPVPLVPLFPDVGVDDAPTGVTAIHVPDIYPVEGQGPFRDLVVEAVHGGGPPEHLRSWREHVESSSSSRSELAPLGRRFRIRHFARALYSRHADSLDRQLTRVRQAFADYFGTSEDAVKRDWSAIGKKLGRDWCVRRGALDE